MASKVKFTDPVTLTPRTDLIYDQEFNETRKYVPKDEDGNVATLRCAIGGVTDEVVQAPVIRYATSDEQARWLSLHQDTDWFRELSEDDRVAPRYIVVDGYGRIDAHVSAHGPDAGIECRVLDTDDRTEGIRLGLLMNTTARPTHYLDLGAFVKGFVGKDKPYAKLDEMATDLDKSAALLSECRKIYTTLSVEQRQECVNKGLSRSAALKMVEKVLAEKDKDGGGDAEKVTVSSTLPTSRRRVIVKRLADFRNKIEAGEIELTDEDLLTVNAIGAFSDFIHGDVPNEGSLTEYLKDNELMTGVDFDFDNEPIEVTVETFFVGCKTARDTMIREEVEKHPDPDLALEEVRAEGAGFSDEPDNFVKWSQIPAPNRQDAADAVMLKCFDRDLVKEREEEKDAKAEERKAKARAKKAKEKEAVVNDISTKAAKKKKSRKG